MASSRRQYPFHLIEPKWQQTWEQQQAFRAFNPNEEIPANHPFAIRHGANAMSLEKVAGCKAPPKFYILDMFPYPSGAGLHVGHPEGYTATDILARYKRAQGFNVLHPMGWDAFGLPAEQYAVKTGQHPRVTTEANIANFTRQIKSLGFSYDWSRELATTDTDYFKWTQWIFLKLYNSYFDPSLNKAMPISLLEDALTEESKRQTEWEKSEFLVSTRKWAVIPERSAERIARIRRNFANDNRLAYVSEQPVWWCEQLGTVLANEEVVDGKSEVGGFPVVRKPMRQWMLRITAYAERLLQDLDTIDWSDSLKEMQRNWIGRSEGAEVEFRIQNSESRITVFTTRPDTLFGATYMVLSPEHPLLKNPEGENSIIPELWSDVLKDEEIDKKYAHLCSDNSPRLAVKFYQLEAARKSDLERAELAKEKTGKWTGLLAINPVNGEKIPVFVADYVLASYGTGAIMAVPAHDERDFEFAKKFKIQIKSVVGSLKPFTSLAINSTFGYDDISKLKRDERTVVINGEDVFVFTSQTECFVGEGVVWNSANSEVSLNDLPTAEAKKKITVWLEAKGLGKKTINYKLRDWLFSRQRYWGEPFPIVWKKDDAGNLYHEALPESSLPVLPPTLEDYKPTPDGQPPLARAQDWVNLPDGAVRETNTMPQWAGSCWYYLRYLDAKNNAAFVGKEVESYWMGASGLSTINSQPSTKSTPGVDLYVGGTEHAVLHLLYARFWHKVLFDLGYVSTPEPFFKLVNQGLILGEADITAFTLENGVFVSAEKVKDIGEESTKAGLRLFGFHQETGEKVFGCPVRADETTVRNFKTVLKIDSTIVVDSRSCKMSKSRGNVVNPDDVLGEYGADAFRLYEMFMGPLQDTKPWNTKGVEGVYRFLGRVWRLFVDEKSGTAFEQAETLAGDLTAENAKSTEKQNELLDLILLDGGITDIAATPAQLKTLHACIKKVTEDLDGMRFNTAISAMMVFINEAMTWPTKPLSVMKPFLQLLAPFAPHIAEELWARLHSTFGLRAPSLVYAEWPKFDAALLVESEMEIPVSVNGKVRDVIKVSATATQVDLEAAAKNSEKVQSFIAGKTIRKIIVVPKRMVNLIVG